MSGLEIKPTNYKKLHIDYKHNRIVFKCNICDNVYKSGINLNRHLKNAHVLKDFKCNQCNFETTTKEKLLMHHTRIHGLPRHACNQCTKKYTTIESLRNHKIKNKFSRVKISPIEGVGVFAIRDIEAGQILIEDIPMKQTNGNFYTEEELIENGVDEENIKLLKDYWCQTVTTCWWANFNVANRSTHHYRQSSSSNY